MGLVIFFLPWHSFLHVVSGHMWAWSSKWSAWIICRLPSSWSLCPIALSEAAGSPESRDHLSDQLAPLAERQWPGHGSAACPDTGRAPAQLCLQCPEGWLIAGQAPAVISIIWKPTGSRPTQQQGLCHMPSLILIRCAQYGIARSSFHNEFPLNFLVYILPVELISPTKGRH